MAPLTFTVALATEGTVTAAPPVARPLILVASESTVRILDGMKEIARYHRSYD
ncbi:MAG: hypothetical protein ACRD19_02170 [Terriglobia bacterium]